MSKKKLVIALGILYVLFIFVYGYASVDIHEKTHKAIFAYHGCDNISITNKIFSGYTQCHSWSNDSTPELQKEALRLNTELDMSDYSLQFLTQLIVTMAALIALLIILVMKE